ncbi:MAG: protein kinase [Clostridiales bacterium]
MINIPGYNILEKIYESSQHKIFKGICLNDGLKVIIKVLNHSVLHDNYQYFKNEYSILKNLEHIGEVIFCYEFLEYNDKKIIVLEDINGVSLDKIIDNNMMKNVRKRVELALRIVEALNNIHESNIIHKNINDSNIILNIENNMMRIIDYKLSTFSKRYYRKFLDDKIDGVDIRFIPPEQSVFNNRLTDYRSDYFSIGVVLYRLFTGEFPFDCSNWNELVEAHFNLTPQEPIKINSQIPKFLSQIIMKLISKESDKRYQSGIGIMNDLKIVLDILNNKVIDNNIQLAKKDYLQEYDLIKKIYGYEKEIKLINNTLGKCFSGSKDIIVLSGNYISDKLDIIRSLMELIKKNNGNIIIGRYYNNSFSKPYSGIVDAINQLAKKIAGELNKNDDFDNYFWKIINNSKVITDLFDEFDKIVSRKESMPVHSIEDNKNRFYYVMQEFIKIFATKDKPLIIVLQDFHFADRSSVELISRIFSDSELSYVTLLLICEQNEFKCDETLKEFRKIQNFNFYNEIVFKEISKKDLYSLVKYLFDFDTKNTIDLVNIIISFYDNKLGNLKKLLKIFIKNKFIFYDGKWKFDKKKIYSEFKFNNINDYVKYNISGLNEETKEILYIFSSVVEDFKFNYIEELIGKSHREIYTNIAKLIENDIIERVNDSYIFINNELKSYVYKNIDKVKRNKIHLNIARSQLKYYKNSREQLYRILNHFDKSKEIISKNENFELVKLFYKAGLNSIESTSYYEAYILLMNSKKLLNHNSWNDFYVLMYDIYFKLSEMSLMAKDYEYCEKICNLLLSKSKTVNEKTNIYGILLKNYFHMNNSIKLEKSIYEVMNLNDIRVPKKIRIYHLLYEAFIFNLIAYKLKKNDKLSKLVDMEFNEDITKKSFMKVTETISDICFFSDNNKFIYVLLKRFSYIIKNGNFRESIFVYIFASIIINMFRSDLKLSYRFTKVSFMLLDKYDMKIYNLKSRYYYNVFLRHSFEPVKNTIEPLKFLFETSFEFGDINFSYASAAMSLYISFLSGIELKGLVVQIDKYSKILKRFGNEVDLSSFKQFSVILDSLMHYNEDEKKEVKIEILNNNKLNYFNQQKLITTIIFMIKSYSIYILQDIISDEEIEKHFKKTKPDIDKKLNYISLHYYFIESLFLLKIYDKKSIKDKKIIELKVKRISKYLRKVSEFCSYNYSHKYYIIQAEFARVKKQYEIAKKNYNNALDSVIKTDYTNEEAMCYELVAKFYIQHGNDTLAIIYLKRSYGCYKKWGAIAKYESLRNKYPKYFKKSISKSNLEKITIGKSVTNVKNYDLEYVLKVSQEISGELENMSFIKKILDISINLIKSESVSFLTVVNGEIILMALLKKNEKIRFFDNIQIDEDNKYLAYKVVEICATSRKKVIVGDAINNMVYNKDDYIKNNYSKSILCLPIKNNNEIEALLYFENNTNCNAFNVFSYKYIDIFLDQISISYNNVHKYELYRQKGTYLENRVKNKSHEIQIATKNYNETYENSEKLINLDVMTGIINRDEFLLRLERLINESESDVLKIIIYKIENLSNINDSFGFEYGDFVIVKSVNLIRNNFEQINNLARWGGNIFIFILINKDLKKSKLLTEEIKNKLENFDFIKDKNSIKIKLAINIFEHKNTISSEKFVIDALNDFENLHNSFHL